MVPVSLAARCSRREAVIGSRAISPTTAPSPSWRKPSSIQAKTDLSSPASTWITRSGGRPACSRPGAKRSCCATHHRTLPCVRAAMPATKQAAADRLLRHCPRPPPHAGSRAPARHRAACDQVGGHQREEPHGGARPRLQAAQCACEAPQWQNWWRARASGRLAPALSKGKSCCYVPYLFRHAARVNPSRRRCDRKPRRTFCAMIGVKAEKRVCATSTTSRPTSRRSGIS